MFLKPIHILQQVLHAVHQTPIGTEVQFVHDVIDGDEFANVEGDFVAEGFGGGIEVDDVDAAAVARAEGEAVLVEGVAVGGFAGAGGAGH
jgi:hypothetical protein